MQYIPPSLSQIIDAVAFQGQPQDFQSDWLAWKSEFDQYFERESDYSLSTDDAGIVGNIPHLLEQLEAAVQRAFEGERKADDLVQYTLDFFEAHDKFYEEREKQYFVQSPPLDRLLKVSVAYLQGQAGMDAVMKRAPDAALAVDALQELYLEAKDGLPEVIIEGTLDGLRRANKGFEMMARYDQEIPREVLEEAIFEIRSAGELLEHLPALFRRFEEEKGSSIPLLGPLLTVLREEDDEEQIEILREQAFPAFLELWESRQDGWLLDPEVAYEILGETEQCISHLSDLLSDYPETEEEFWETVERLEDLFLQIRDNALDLETLPSSPYWPEAQMLLNLLRGGAPLYAAHSLASAISEGREHVPVTVALLGDHLIAFLKHPEPLPLLRALKLIKEDLELSKTTRPCTACQERIPLEARKCEACGAEVEKLSVSG